MFGTNSVMKQDLNDGSMLLVKELFDTMQGEGPDAGRPAFFIRLGGCNLRCLFCDTDFDTNLKWMGTLSVIQLAQASNRRLVVITGGEPFRQNIAPLCAALIESGHRVQVETAGTLWVPGLPEAVEIIVSPKTPIINEQIMQRAIAFKYIVRDGQTDPQTGLPNTNPQTGQPMTVAYPWDHFISSLSTNAFWRGLAPTDIFIQPCDDHDPDVNRNNLQEAVEVAMKYGYRLSIQQHKIAGLP